MFKKIVTKTIAFTRKVADILRKHDKRYPKEISLASHPHNLILIKANDPFYCKECDELGFGLSYTCNSGCKFHLHKECGKQEAQIKYPFSKKCVLKFQDRGSGVGSDCKACGKKIKGCHYRCLCSFIKRNLHPSCLYMENTLEVFDGLTLDLQKAATSHCLHCGTKDLRFMVRGWAYVSSCGNYSYHVACVKEIINTNWNNGYFEDKSDPLLIIKQQFLKDVEKMGKMDQFLKKMDMMDRLDGAGKKKRMTKAVKLVFASVFHTLTVKPFGLVDTVTSLFTK